MNKETCTDQELVPLIEVFSICVTEEELRHAGSVLTKYQLTAAQRYRAETAYLYELQKFKPKE